MENGNRADDLRVGIIGAGVSGLACCKHCSEKGLNVTVFEGKSGLGGVWRASYSSTKLQSPRRTYAFSDFPWLESVPAYPSHHQVLHYLESYARFFGCMDKIRFNSQVVEVRKKAKPSDRSLEMESSKISNPQRVGRQEVDQLLESLIPETRNAEPEVWHDGFVTWDVCVRRKVPGLEGPVDYVDELPSFPAFKGPDVFNGRVLHALDYSGLDSKSTRALISGKKVVVVGFQKTSLDIAVEVAEINEGVDIVQPCTLLFRRAHWMYPRHRQAFGLFPLGYLFSTRFSGFWTPKPGQRFWQSMLQTSFSPLNLLVWKLVEYYLRFTLPLDRYGLVPEHSLFDDLSACVLPQVPHTLLRHLGDGNILAKKAPNWDFCATGVRLADGTSIEADVVILCTGYDGNSKLKAILPEDDRALLFEPDQGVLSLYRGIIHPHIPNMGFVGYLEGPSSVLSGEISAIWLANLLQRMITLPNVATMESERRAWLRHCKRTRFFARSSACVATMQIWHNDKLCKDMGLKSLRKRTWWEEIFSIYVISDYKALTS